MMKRISYTQAVTEALQEEMRRDPKVVIWGEDTAGAGGAFHMTPGFADEFGTNRVRDTPIAENIIVGLAVGAAMTGLRPIAELMFADFFGCAMDQVMNQMAKARYMFGGQITLPITVRAASGAGTRAAAQHSQSLHSWFMNLPGLKVVVPSTPADVKGLLKSSIRDNNPVLFFEHKALFNIKDQVPVGEYSIPLGVADVKRQGTDVTIVAVQQMVYRALEAAEILAERGISAEVIDPRTLVPLDRETIVNSIKKTRRLVVVDECNLTSGAQNEIIALAVERAFDYLDAPPRRLGVPDVPFAQSPVLEDYILPKSGQIVSAVQEIIR
ncbi:MAG: alpha-ketoacid dehydrogenase subunit beta [Anaerolineae bacterium]|nr:alpha-ketoacid dehydrogenase subunit beta [Anaerolineae bacterium]